MQVQYPFKKQAQIVLATCVLHYFIIDHNSNAEQFGDDDAPSIDNFVVSEPGNCKPNTPVEKQQSLENNYNKSNDNEDDSSSKVLCGLRRGANNN
ncbi:hypothetical protein EJ110_NYTH02671 [Nymphaea thermarum]|nr:hypothetical protein EJ110_NYTH02671 [Nymphaea thermarum]